MRSSVSFFLSLLWANLSLSASADTWHHRRSSHHHHHHHHGKHGSKTSQNQDSSAWADPFQRDDVLMVNGVRIGYHPDNGDGGGTPQDINEVNAYQGYKSFSVGLYAHVFESRVFDGAELYDVNASLLNGHSGLDPDSVDPSTINIQKDKLFEQVVDSGAVLIATVMPCLSWSGMTRDNNTQAVRIAQALKRYTDAGVVTWLRYGHEANYYNSDDCHEAPDGGKVYVGGPENVKEGWAVVNDAVKQYAPAVKMYWSPNDGTQESIEQYAPDDTSTIDIVGIDWYPDTANASLSQSYQWLHNKYCSDQVPFTVGETSIHQALDQRQQHFKTWTSEEEVAKLPYFKALTWFNFNKDADGACENGCPDAKPLHDMLAGKDCAECHRGQVRHFFKKLAD